MRSIKSLLAVLAVAVLSGCPDPVSSPVSRYGQVRVDFGVGSRAAGSLPANVASIAILVRGSGMADVQVSLTAPKLSTVLEIPAGRNREFTVTARDSTGSVVFLGKSTMDIQAGADHELAVAMKTMVSLSFNANGGSGTPPATIYNEPGAQVTIPTTAGTLSLAGYFIELWDTAADGTGTDYLPGQSIAMPAVSTTLYARWTPITYTITYHLNGGTSHSNPTSYTILSGAIGLSAPVWAGRTFESWHDSPALNSPVSSIPAGSTGNRNLYAKWLVPTYYITFNENGGSGFMSSQGIPEGSTVALTPNAFTSAGYTFAGWGIAAGGPVVYADGAAYTMGGADVTLYAQWTPNPYTVTYDAQGGSPAVPASAVVSFGANYPTPPGTSRLGHTFGGWWTGIGGTGTQVTGATPMTTPSNHTLYAQWTPNPYTVTYDAQGGSPTVPASAVVSFGANYPTPPGTSRLGHTFGGWWTGIGGTGTQVTGATPMTTASNHTLYAQWTPIFAGGDGSVGTPYQIATVQQLKDVNNFLSSHFILITDLDVGSETNWLPLGNSTTKFSGTFNGNDKIISNLTINSPFDPGRGLFGYVNGAVISNLGLVNINIIDSYNYAGGLIGQSDGATQVSNCYATGTIQAYQSAGGLIGNVETGTIIVTDCYADVDISTDTYGNIGGLVGRTIGGSITRSYALGTISFTSGTPMYVGGLVGFNNNTAIINCYARGNVAGDTFVGGLVGYKAGSGNITNSYSTGLVAGTSDTGGLVGYLTGTGIVTSSYYDSLTSGQSDSGKGFGMSTTIMQDSSGVALNYPGWDFAIIWQIIGTAYPTLR